jgi:hypothetical protein
MLLKHMLNANFGNSECVPVGQVVFAKSNADDILGLTIARSWTASGSVWSGGISSIAILTPEPLRNVLGDVDRIHH